MKTLKLSVFGMLILFSKMSIGQVNNNININVNPDSTQNIKNEPEKAVKTDTVIKEVHIVEAPAPQPQPKVEKPEPPLKSGEIGVRFMPTFSKFDLRNSNGEVIEGDLALGYGYGGLLAVTGKHVGLQLEVIYNPVSQKYKDHEIERTVDISYLNVPLLLTLNTDKSKPVNFNVAFGPQLGINTGSKVTSSGNGDVDTVRAVVALKQSDLGIAYGAGLEFCLNPMRTVRLNLGFRGVYGLVDISDNNKNKATGSYFIIDKTNRESYAGYLGLSFLF
jgi:hypothetical protein